MVRLKKLFFALPLLLAACQSTPIPPALAVMGTETLRVNATGVQIYTWQASSNSWKFKEPAATFSSLTVAGKHSAGPTWEANDGSKVTGKAIANAPSLDAASVPWLLIKADTHAGDGVLSAVTFIQRVNTSGGVAPTAPGTSDGQEIRVPYTATYIFYGPGATTQPKM